MMLRLEVRLIVANASHKMHTYVNANMHLCAVQPLTYDTVEWGSRLRLEPVYTLHTIVCLFILDSPYYTVYTFYIKFRVQRTNSRLHGDRCV